jgi:hypothetical protein
MLTTSEMPHLKGIYGFPAEHLTGYNVDYKCHSLRFDVDCQAALLGKTALLRLERSKTLKVSVGPPITRSTARNIVICSCVICW